MNVNNKPSGTVSSFCQTIPWSNPAVPIQLFWFSTKSLSPTYYHYHKTVVEIHIIRSGGRRYFVDYKWIPIKNYTAIVIQPGQIHKRFHDGLWLQEINLVFDLALLSARQNSSIAATLPTWIKLSSVEFNTIDMRCRLMEHEKHCPSATALTMIQNELENLILLLQRASEKKIAEPVSDGRVLKIIDFIETNYARELNIEQLAAMAAMSPSYLSHRFKRQTGISIKHYILQCRIAAAKVCLVSTSDVKVVVLAEQLGFSDLSLFYRCFKKYVGLTPEAYRRISHKQNRKY